MTRHSLTLEAALLVAVYLAYDASRGLVGGGRRTAVRHAQTIATSERHLHIYVEGDLQRAASHVPALLDVFGVGYATFHLGVTLSALMWLFHRRPSAFVKARTLIIIASVIALIGFTLYPTAPPRAAGIGIADTLSLGRTTSQSGLLRLLYNPYAALPSIHVAYAIIIGGTLFIVAGRRSARVAALIYPAFVAFEVVATGSHFILDVAAGTAVDVFAVMVLSWVAGWARAAGQIRTPARPSVLFPWPLLGQPWVALEGGGVLLRLRGRPGRRTRTAPRQLVAWRNLAKLFGGRHPLRAFDVRSVPSLAASPASQASSTGPIKECA